MADLILRYQRFYSGTVIKIRTQQIGLKQVEKKSVAEDCLPLGEVLCHPVHHGHHVCCQDVEVDLHWQLGEQLQTHDVYDEAHVGKGRFVTDGLERLKK